MYGLEVVRRTFPNENWPRKQFWNLYGTIEKSDAYPEIDEVEMKLIVYTSLSDLHTPFMDSKAVLQLFSDAFLRDLEKSLSWLKTGDKFIENDNIQYLFLYGQEKKIYTHFPFVFIVTEPGNELFWSIYLQYFAYSEIPPHFNALDKKWGNSRNTYFPLFRGSFRDYARTSTQMRILARELKRILKLYPFFKTPIKKYIEIDSPEGSKYDIAEKTLYIYMKDGNIASLARDILVNDLLCLNMPESIKEKQRNKFNMIEVEEAERLLQMKNEFFLTLLNRESIDNLPDNPIMEAYSWYSNAASDFKSWFNTIFLPSFPMEYVFPANPSFDAINSVKSFFNKSNEDDVLPSSGSIDAPSTIDSLFRLFHSISTNKTTIQKSPILKNIGIYPNLEI